MNLRKLGLRSLTIVLAFTVTALSLSSCTTSVSPPDLGGIYNRSAQYHGIERNPVIVLPGILGSKLKAKESGLTVWGAFGGDYADPSDPEDLRLIALPMKPTVRGL